MTKQKTECQHPYSMDYMTSMVHWTDRKNSIGWMIHPCGVCGELMRWEITA